MWYVYILESLKDNDHYVGLTDDLKNRFKKHNQGKVASTKFRTPFKLIHYEAYLHKNDATNREQFLKTGLALPSFFEIWEGEGKELDKEKLKKLF